MRLILALTMLLLSINTFGKEASRENIFEMCQKATIPSKVPECFANFNGNYLDSEVIPVCQEATIPSRVPECAMNLLNLSFTHFAVLACQKATIPSNLPSCLKDLGNLNVTESDFMQCNQSTISFKVPQCLSTISMPMNDFDTLDLLHRALNSLDNGNYGRVRRLIKKAIKTLD